VSRITRSTALLFLATLLQGCLVYEYEHEFWLRVDGSGTVFVTGRPGLWAAFKGVGRPDALEATVTREAARALFERSGLRVKRVTLTRRDGRPYLFVSADFDDVNKLNGTAAFPDVTIGLRREGDRQRLEGTWVRPAKTPDPAGSDRQGLMAVRFHLSAKVYDHKNAVEGVERGNIVAWRQDVAQALDGQGLEFGATMGRRSILHSTVGLFAVAIGLGLGILGFTLYLVFRRGQKRGGALDSVAEGTDHRSGR
jgi:hypothetical protein